jgi:hypothetical protein
MDDTSAKKWSVEQQGALEQAQGAPEREKEKLK